MATQWGGNSYFLRFQKVCQGQGIQKMLLFCSIAQSIWHKLLNLGWTIIQYALYKQFQTYILDLCHLFWRQKKPGGRCSSKIQMWIHSGSWRSRTSGSYPWILLKDHPLKNIFVITCDMCNPFVHETQVTKFQKLNCCNIIMSIAQYQHLRYHWDIDANSSWNSQWESWRKSDSTRLGHAHQLSRIWDPKFDTITNRLELFKQTYILGRCTWVFSKAYDNPIVVWQGFLKCTRYNPSSLNGDGIKKNPLSAGVKFRGFSKIQTTCWKFQGNPRAALHHSP